MDELLEVVFILAVLAVEVLLELLVAHLITLLEPTVVLTVLLHSVVGEVHRRIQPAQVVLVAGRTDIALFVPISFQPTVHAADHHVMPNIELPLVVEKRLADVLLQNIGLQFTVFMPFLVADNLLHLR